MEVDETKKKKKKCEAETIQRRGGKTEERERKWILKFGREKSRFFFFFTRYLFAGLNLGPAFIPVWPKWL